MIKFKERHINKMESISDTYNSIVYRAEWEGHPIVIKELTEERKDWFDNEVEIMALIDHPYVMSLRGIISDSDLPSIVMDYMPNGTLDDYLKKIQKPGDEFRIDMARRIGRGICYLHENNILHLDLKTANILLDDQDMPKIADFGCSAILEDYETIVESDDSKGTPRWYTPESLETCGYTSYYTYSRETDVYTYALLVWSLYSLQKPYKSLDDYDTINSKIMAGEHEDEQLITEPTVQKLCLRAWSLRPTKRPQAEEFVSALAKLTTW